MLSSQDIPPPVSNTAYGLTLQEDAPAAPLVEPAVNPPVERPAVQEDGPIVQHPNVHEDNPIAQHPNGSEGWLPAEDLPANPPSPKVAATSAAGVSRHGTTASSRQAAGTPSPGVSRHGTTATRHGVFAGSPGGADGGASLGRASSRRSAHTTTDGRVIIGGAFVNGAGTTGPYSTAPIASDDDLAVRAQEANANLTPHQRSKIAKTEAKNGRRLSKIIKQEAKTEKESLSIAISELANLQKHQKAAVKSEARVQASHEKLVNAFKKTEAAYLNAKMNYETAQAEMQAEARALEVLKSNAREATERVQDKSAEVDALRRTLAVDEREREIKLGELKGRRSGFWG